MVRIGGGPRLRRSWSAAVVAPLVAGLVAVVPASPAQAVPAPVAVMPMVSVGNGSSCVVTNVGDVYCRNTAAWGFPVLSQYGSAKIPLPEASTSASAGFGQACAIAISGRLYCWGINFYGGIGAGDDQNHELPVAVVGLPDPATDPVVQVGTGNAYSCALTQSGAAWCWGFNQKGQLGDGTTTNRFSAVRVLGVTAAARLSVGAQHSCVVTVSGVVRCWGSNGAGEIDPALGSFVTSSIAVNLPGGDTASIVAAGSVHSCALGGTGKVYCWGDDFYGQLGNGYKGADGCSVASCQSPGVGATMSTVLNMPPSGASIIDLDARGDRSCVVTSTPDPTGSGLPTNDVYCWGENLYGATDWTTANTDHAVPVKVTVLTTTATSISAGFRDTCALSVEGSGSLICWGQLLQVQTSPNSSTIVATTTVPAGSLAAPPPTAPGLSLSVAGGKVTATASAPSQLFGAPVTSYSVTATDGVTTVTGSSPVPTSWSWPFPYAARVTVTLVATNRRGDSPPATSTVDVVPDGVVDHRTVVLTGGNGFDSLPTTKNGVTTGSLDLSATGTGNVLVGTYDALPPGTVAVGGAGTRYLSLVAAPTSAGAVTSAQVDLCDSAVVTGSTVEIWDAGSSSWQPLDPANFGTYVGSTSTCIQVLVNSGTVPTPDDLLGAPLAVVDVSQLQPVITGVDTSQLDSLGTFTIQGSGFAPGATVTWNGSQLSVGSSGANALVATPPTATSIADCSRTGTLTVTNPNGLFDTSQVTLTYSGQIPGSPVACAKPAAPGLSVISVAGGVLATVTAPAGIVPTSYQLTATDGLTTQQSTVPSATGVTFAYPVASVVTVSVVGVNAFGDSPTTSASATVVPPGLQNAVVGTGTSPTATTSTSGGTLTATGTGAGNVLVGGYTAGPVPLTGFPLGGARFVGVYTTTLSSTFTAVTARWCSTTVGPRTKVQWWNPSGGPGGTGAWVAVSPTPTLDTSSTPACLVLSLSPTSTPSLSQLAGGVFGVGQPSASGTVSAPASAAVGAPVQVRVTVRDGLGALVAGAPVVLDGSDGTRRTGTTGATGIVVLQVSSTKAVKVTYTAKADGVPVGSASTTYAFADVRLRQTASGTFRRGSVDTYALTVTSTGRAATGVITVTDRLPSGVAFVRAVGTGWSCTGTRTLTCTYRSLAPGASTSRLTITVRVTAPSRTVLVNTAVARLSATDPTPANNTASTRFVVA